MIDITLQNFEAELINASMRAAGAAGHLGAVVRPVQDARPGAREARGRLRRPLQAGQAQRRRRARDRRPAVPDVRRAQHPVLRAVRHGQPVDGFVGALPEAQIRKFLDKHVPSSEDAQAEAQAEEAEALEAEGDTEAALDKLQQAVADAPGNDAARCDYVKLLLELRPRRRGAAWRSSRWPAKAALDARIAALGQWLDASEKAADGAQRRCAARGDRRQQARLRRPLRAGAASLRRRPLHRGDGRAARDRDARQGLERRAGAQDLRRDPGADEQAGAARPTPEPAEGHARGRRQADRARRPTRWSTSTAASSAWRCSDARGAIGRAVPAA